MEIKSGSFLLGLSIGLGIVAIWYKSPLGIWLLVPILISIAFINSED